MIVRWRWGKDTVGERARRRGRESGNEELDIIFQADQIANDAVQWDTEPNEFHGLDKMFTQPLKTKVGRD